MFKAKQIIILCLSFTFLLTASWAVAADHNWQTDFAAAKAKAEKEHKYLLLDFTGSDWCGWCKKLKKEVFSQKFFQAKAPEQFILVELDFPQKTMIEEKLRKQNQALAKTYSVTGYPSIILTDAKGVEFARTGYKPGGPDIYLKYLDTLVTNYKQAQILMQEAEKLNGVEKAKKLDQAIALLVKNGSKSGYDNLSDEIIALDKDGKAGLRPKYELPRKIDLIESQLQKDKDFDKAVTALDKLVPQAKSVPSLQQRIYLFQAGILIKGKGDKVKGMERLQLAQKAAPDTSTGKQLVKFIAKMEKEGTGADKK